MKNYWKTLFLVSLLAPLWVSCDDDDSNDTPAEQALTLNISGLADLGSNYAYEGWIMVDGAPQTTGTFTVDANGNLSTNTFMLDRAALEAATAFILTLEPSPDSDPAPSEVHIIAGDFSGTSASLNTAHPAAIGTDFTGANGGYILATPTNGADTDETSGVWWLDPNAGPGASLSLPELPAGWAYEGWAVIEGQPVTTGTFTTASGADAMAPYSGSQAGPPFPGEDFLMNAPSGLTFPVDLSGTTIVVSVEPVPDNSPAPFLLKPLVGSVPSGAEAFTLYGMDNNAAATNPSGTASK